MNRQVQGHTTADFLIDEDLLSRWAEGFLVDRKTRNLSPYSISFYRVELRLFLRYCDGQVLTRIGQLTPDALRRYFLFLGEYRNPGGVHAGFRAIRALLNWYEGEAEPRDWANPFKKLRPPRLADEPLEPVEIETIRALIRACNGPLALRDRALFLFLLDSGTRAREALAVNVSDLDLVMGEVLVRKGKGGKARTVFVGKKTRLAIRAYLKSRSDQHPALWTTDDTERLTYWGLNQILRRRCKDAGIPKVGLHSFRRAFALNCLRQGMDLITLSRLMGHADLTMLRRYLAQTTGDLHSAHARFGTVDNLL